MISIRRCRFSVLRTNAPTLGRDVVDREEEELFADDTRLDPQR